MSQKKPALFYVGHGFISKVNFCAVLAVLGYSDRGLELITIFTLNHLVLAQASGFHAVNMFLTVIVAQLLGFACTLAITHLLMQHMGATKVDRKVELSRAPYWKQSRLV